MTDKILHRFRHGIPKPLRSPFNLGSQRARKVANMRKRNPAPPLAHANNIEKGEKGFAACSVAKWFRPSTDCTAVFKQPLRATRLR